MELKVGDYVRTEKGKIDKYSPIWVEYNKFENRYYYVYPDEEEYYDHKELITKSSPNIIDLIEVGDYVNRDRVKALKGDIESHKINNEDDVIYTEYINDYDEWCGFEEDEIKSIVTKEQFESIKYKIGE